MNDSYTADCIKFRSTVNVSQSRFQVKGVKPQTAQKPETPVQSSSAVSLALKLPRGKRSLSLETPPRAEGRIDIITDQQIAPVNTLDSESSPINTPRASQVHGDLLEELIEQVKGAEVLVCQELFYAYIASVTFPDSVI